MLHLLISYYSEGSSVDLSTNLHCITALHWLPINPLNCVLLVDGSLVMRRNPTLWPLARALPLMAIVRDDEWSNRLVQHLTWEKWALIGRLIEDRLPTLGSSTWLYLILHSLRWTVFVRLLSAWANLRWRTEVLSLLMTVITIEGLSPSSSGCLISVSLFTSCLWSVFYGRLEFVFTWKNILLLWLDDIFSLCLFALPLIQLIAVCL